MGGVFFCSQSLMLHLPSFSAFRRTNFGSPKVSLKEIADGYLPIASNRNLHHLVVSSKQAGDDRENVFPQNLARGRSPKGNENKGKHSSKDPEEIISLFRKIQSSVSKGSVSSKNRSSKISEPGNVPPVESILEVLRQSRAKVKATRKEGDESSPRKEQKANDLLAPDTKLTRPPSNFVRRSPIPTSNQGLKANLRSEDQLPPTPRDGDSDDKGLGIPEMRGDSLRKFEELKLAELKELAKSRGIKGYSKLRKAELVRLLVRL